MTPPPSAITQRIGLYDSATSTQLTGVIAAKPVAAGVAISAFIR